MDAQTLRHMAVVSLDEAGRIGRVSDVLFGRDPLHAEALRVTSDHGELLVPYTDVSSVGRDAVTIQSADVARSAGVRSGADLVGLEDVRRLKVVDEQGTLVGTVHAVDIDADSGAALSLVAERGGILGVGTEHRTIEADAIRGIGPEIVTVRTGGDVAG